MAMEDSFINFLNLDGTGNDSPGVLICDRGTYQTLNIFFHSVRNSLPSCKMNAISLRNKCTSKKNLRIMPHEVTDT
jgi:hypothetical protein